MRHGGRRAGYRSPAAIRLTISIAMPAATMHHAAASIGLTIRASQAWVPRLERDLVERAQQGDAAAFDLLVARVGDRLFGLAYHVLRDRDTAEDAAQQALVQIWRMLPGLRDPERFDRWSYRIVVRAAFAESARHRRWIVKPAAVADSPSTVRDHANAVADRDQLGRGFDRLSLEHRAVVALKYFADRSDDEIAEILEVPVGTVRSRLHHSLRRLRGELDADARPGRGVAP